MKTLTIIKFVFTLIGTALLCVAGYMAMQTRTFIAHAASAEGVVVDLVRSSSSSSTYSPEIRFTDRDGRTVQFVTRGSSNPPSFSRGEHVRVYYDPANPQHAKADGFLDLWFGPTLLGGMGFVFFLIGGGMVLAGVLRRRKQGDLKLHGRRILVDKLSAKLNTSLTVNGRHPYRILAQWQDPATSLMHVFESDNIWFDPADYLQGKTATVFLDRDDPGRYYVDLSFLPKPAT